MNKIYDYYNNTISAYTRTAESLKRKIHLLGTVRLALVAGMLAMIWFFKSYHWTVLAGTVVCFVVPFVALMVWHTKLFARRCYAEAMIQLCRGELKGLDYDFSAFDGATEKNSADHSFTLDLDIFGDRSLFQSVNRTVTPIGKEMLVDWFTHPLTDKDEILQRQEAIRELETFTRLRQHFYVTGILQPGGQNDLRRLTGLTRTAPFFAKSHFWNILIWLVPAIWILLIVTTSIGLLPPAYAGMFFAISFVTAYVRNKKIVDLHNTVNKTEKILYTYANLMKCVEKENFRSRLLADINRQLTNNNKTASQIIRQLSGLIGKLDQRFSAIGLILNIFMLRDTRIAIQLEKWNEDHLHDTTRWFEALARFDSFCSLAGFAFNHPGYIYPAIADRYFKMEGKALGHPLLKRNVCVRNDINIEKSPWFLIITGANMAGKSTYLRTIGVNYLLACIGAPVCADSLTVYPARMVTSLRTADSLMSNESYFFAELKRLKMIIDRLKQGEQLFIILDEILKGTNSVDKQKGSLALMKQLTAYKTCGIIATHDLALGELEEEFPDQIKNYRFEADITDNELTFSYRLREGVAQNMNACFLMNQMGITVE